MARHRMVRNMSYEDDLSEDVYGRSLDELDYAISPATEAQFMYSMQSRHDPTLSAFMEEQPINEEDEYIEEQDSESYQDYVKPKLRPHEEEKLQSGLEYIRDVMGESCDDGAATKYLIEHNFNVEKALDSMLNEGGKQSWSSTSTLGGTDSTQDNSLVLCNKSPENARTENVGYSEEGLTISLERNAANSTKQTLHSHSSGQSSVGGLMGLSLSSISRISKDKDSQIEASLPVFGADGKYNCETLQPAIGCQFKSSGLMNLTLNSQSVQGTSENTNGGESDLKSLSSGIMGMDLSSIAKHVNSLSNNAVLPSQAEFDSKANLKDSTNSFGTLKGCISSSISSLSGISGSKSISSSSVVSLSGDSSSGHVSTVISSDVCGIDSSGLSGVSNLTGIGGLSLSSLASVAGLDQYSLSARSTEIPKSETVSALQTLSGGDCSISLSALASRVKECSIHHLSNASWAIGNKTPEMPSCSSDRQTGINLTSALKIRPRDTPAKREREEIVEGDTPHLNVDSVTRGSLYQPKKMKLRRKPTFFARILCATYKHGRETRHDEAAVKSQHLDTIPVNVTLVSDYLSKENIKDLIFKFETESPDDIVLLRQSKAFSRTGERV